MKKIFPLPLVLPLSTLILMACSQKTFTGGLQALQATSPQSVSLNIQTTETFTQTQTPTVDILVIDDNSLSMQSLQQKLATKFSSMVSALNGIDYHLGVTTTDLDSVSFNQDGRLLTWAGTSSITLSPHQANADSIFSNTIPRPETLTCSSSSGNCPSGNEQPTLAVIRAIQQASTANAGFFRPTGYLAVLVLSNEDELSDGLTPVPSLSTGQMLTPTLPESLLSTFAVAFGSAKKLLVNGIIIRPGDSSCLVAQQSTGGLEGAYFGTHIATLAALTGGSTFSICDSDFTESLTAISQKVRNLVNSFGLANTPVPGSIQVTMTPAPAQLPSFSISGKSVVFSTPPPAGTEIQISYAAQSN
jgi:hypothetical protein